MLCDLEKKLLPLSFCDSSYFLKNHKLQYPYSTFNFVFLCFSFFNIQSFCNLFTIHSVFLMHYGIIEVKATLSITIKSFLKNCLKLVSERKNYHAYYIHCLQKETGMSKIFCPLLRGVHATQPGTTKDCNSTLERDQYSRSLHIYSLIMLLLYYTLNGIHNCLITSYYDSIYTSILKSSHLLHSFSN